MTARALQLGTDTAQPNDSERRPLVIDKPSRSPARPRSSLVFYKACARAVDQETIVWDVGCGDGQGTSLLVSPGRTVFGFTLGGSTPDNVNRECGATFFPSLPPAVTPDESPDLIIVSDVLGYVDHPESLLRQLRSCSKPSTRLLIWEPRSEPTQQLPEAKLRAWSTQELTELLALSGWCLDDQTRVCATFTSLAATGGPPEFAQALSRILLGLPDAEMAAPNDLPPELRAALHVQKARVALNARDADGATSHFLAALNVQPTNSVALCGLARLALTGEALADAVHLIRTCLEVDPANLQALQLWTHILELTNPEGRITAYQALANLSPADANTLSKLAQLYAESGEPLLAIQDLERLRRYHPAPSLDLALTLGWLLHSVGRDSDAEVEARLASLIDPDGSEVKELLAALAGRTSPNP